MAQDDGGQNIAWFLAGAALGAAAALLLAPQSGSETRDIIRRRALEGRDRLKESGREAYGRGRELYDRGKGLADEAAERFEKGKEAAGEFYERGKGLAKEAFERAKSGSGHSVADS